MMRSSSNEHRLLAIALTLVAVISPLYIDRRRRKTSTGRQPDPDEETLTGGPSASFLLLLLVSVAAAAAATATATRGAIRLASYKRPGAIALAVLAVLSPLYIDRDEEEEETEEPFGNGFVQLFVLLGLVVAIALSCYFDRSFTRFDPYWIHRVGGSSTGILILLLVLAFVLKFKA